jgi:hypothetical protein
MHEALGKCNIKSKVHGVKAWPLLRLNTLPSSHPSRIEFILELLSCFLHKGGQGKTHPSWVGLECEVFSSYHLEIMQIR